MNQAILLNSDLTFVPEKNCWRLTGFSNGQAITVYLAINYLPKESIITDDVLFSVECDIENWLEKNEPDEKSEIHL